MTDKEKIIAYIDKLLEKYPKNYYLLTVAEFIDSLHEESVSDDLDGAAEKHALQCHSKKASVATLAASIYDFRAGALWQKQRISIPVSDDLEKASKEWLISRLDKSYEPYGERKMMELTRFDGYDMMKAYEEGYLQAEKDNVSAESLP